MSEISNEEAQRAAMLLSAAIKSAILYPQAHPALRQPLQELSAIMAEMLRERQELHLGVVEGTFFIDSRLIVSPNAAVEELTDRLAKKRIDAITVHPGVSPDDLFHFASLLARRDTSAETVPALLEKMGVQNIRLGIEQAVQDGSAEQGGTGLARIYFDALNAVRETMREVDNGRIPAGDLINDVVDDMVSVTMENPTTLLGLAMIKDYDNYTFSHSVNVGILALSLGAHLGLDRKSLHEINTAGLLHDIGKTRVDKNILNSPGKLSDEEFGQMKRHPEEGAKIVAEMKSIDPRVAEVVLGHHIKHDRTGYPEWARERSFGLFAELVAVADCYDAITTLRSYQAPTLPKAAMEIMRRLSGTTLNGELVQKFEEMMGEHPVGSLVRLDTNEIALVVKPHPMESVAPAVKVVVDARGDLLQKPRLLSLAATGGTRYASIISQVDPLLKNIALPNQLLSS